MEHHIKTLVSQNHLIDLLELGLTYPIRNLPVRPKNWKVAFGETTFILIHSSEPGVIYELHDEDDQPFPGGARRKTGNGKTLEIPTPEIKDVTRFKVLATKKKSGQTLSTYLIPQRPLVVQVGLDAGIEVRLKDGTDTYDFNSKINVEIPLSQEGVLYRLIDDKKNILSEPVLGTRSAIILTSIGLKEDTQIIVRAVKPADPGNPPPMNKWEDLTTTLPKILILPDITVNVTLLDPVPLSFDAATQVRISDTQKSTNYQLFTYLLKDDDFVHNRVTPVDGPDILSLKPAGSPKVKVRVPKLPVNWNAPTPFVKAGNKRTGNGGLLSIPLPKQEEDILVVILAEKKDSGLRRVVKEMKLVLIKPDTTLTLSPPADLLTKGESGIITVRSSQPGVIYQLRNKANTKNTGNPGFHHKNRGIGEARIGLDYVIDRFDTDFTILNTGELDATTEFKVMAIKAATSVSVLMDNEVTVQVKPVS